MQVLYAIWDGRSAVGVALYADAKMQSNRAMSRPGKAGMHVNLLTDTLGVQKAPARPRVPRKIMQSRPFNSARMHSSYQPAPCMWRICVRPRVGLFFDLPFWVRRLSATN